MSVEILVAAKDFNTFKRGWPVVVKDSPAVWGSKEGLPQFVRLTIPDATKQQVWHFLNQWPVVFQHSIVGENAQGYRLKIEVDPNHISLTGQNRGQLKSKMLTMLTSIGAQNMSWTSDYIIFDIAKPADLVELKSQFADHFDAVFSQRRYYFSTADVTQAVALGGELTLTKAQVLNRIIDRYTE